MNTTGQRMLHLTEALYQIGVEKAREECKETGEPVTWQKWWLILEQKMKVDDLIEKLQTAKKTWGNLDVNCSASHENWLEEKYVNGWHYGAVKDQDKKEHPCCVPYEQLPVEQRVKDALFVGVVRAMKVLL